MERMAGFGTRLVGALAALTWAGMLTGCVAIGYTSGGGWFLWPGGGVLLVLLVLFLLLRRR